MSIPQIHNAKLSAIGKSKKQKEAVRILLGNHLIVIKSYGILSFHNSVAIGTSNNSIGFQEL